MYNKTNCTKFIRILPYLYRNTLLLTQINISYKLKKIIGRSCKNLYTLRRVIYSKQPKNKIKRKEKKKRKKRKKKIILFLMSKKHKGKEKIF